MSLCKQMPSPLVWRRLHSRQAAVDRGQIAALRTLPRIAAPPPPLQPLPPPQLLRQQPPPTQLPPLSPRPLPLQLPHLPKLRLLLFGMAARRPRVPKLLPRPPCPATRGKPRSRRPDHPRLRARASLSSVAARIRRRVRAGPRFSICRPRSRRSSWAGSCSWWRRSASYVARYCRAVIGCCRAGTACAVCAGRREAATGRAAGSAALTWARAAVSTAITTR